MSWTESLLPPENTDPWDYAVEAVDAQRYPLGWAVLRTLQNPFAIPDDLLPLLAWAFSVDIWHAEWDIATKRSVTAAASADHALIGTMAGIKRYLEIEGVTLVQAVRPPQAMYLASDPNPAELAAYIASLPEMRTYLAHRTGEDDGGTFLDVDYADDRFLMEDRGSALYGRQTDYIKGGVTTPVYTYTVQTTVVDSVVVDRVFVSVPGDGGAAVFLDVDYADDGFVDGQVSSPEGYTLDLRRDVQSTQSVFPVSVLRVGLPLYTPRYERASITGNVEPDALILDVDFIDEGFLLPDNAGLLVFDRLRFFDPSIPAPHSLDGDFLDDGRLGFDHYTIELLADASRTATLSETFLDVDFADDGFLVPDDLDKVNRAMDAVNIAKGVENRALMAFDTVRPIRLGDGRRLDGSWKLGGTTRRYL